MVDVSYSEAIYAGRGEFYSGIREGERVKVMREVWPSGYTTISVQSLEEPGPWLSISRPLRDLRPVPSLRWLDRNGTPLRVGDWVRYGLAEGEVRILEVWPATGGNPEEAGVYVSQIGYWGDFRAVPASRVERLPDVDATAPIFRGA